MFKQIVMPVKYSLWNIVSPTNFSDKFLQYRRTYNKWFNGAEMVRFFNKVYKNIYDDERSGQPYL